MAAGPRCSRITLAEFMWKLLAILALGVLVGCGHLSNPQADAGLAASKYRPWKEAPPVKIEDALPKAVAFLDGKHVDLSRGYVLEVSRGESWWYFWFTPLPVSPDYNVVVRVYDSGGVDVGW